MTWLEDSTTMNVFFFFFLVFPIEAWGIFQPLLENQERSRDGSFGHQPPKKNPLTTRYTSRADRERAEQEE